MLIQEACRRSGLTRKAIAYYEQSGLIHPVAQPNGYRAYSDADVASLREIAALRALGVGVRDIGEILTAENKAGALAKQRPKLEQDIRRDEARLRWLTALSGTYTIAADHDDILRDIDGACTIQEKLAQAFPGAFGQYVAWHFGRFLSDRIETDAQRQAYARILAWLDALEDFEVLPELTPPLELDPESLRQVGKGVADALADADGFLREHDTWIEEYKAYRLSDECKDSPAGRWQRMMRDFQARTGYSDVFLENMKALSPSYRAYSARLAEANEKLLAAHPALRQLTEE